MARVPVRVIGETIRAGWGLKVDSISWDGRSVVHNSGVFSRLGVPVVQADANSYGIDIEHFNVTYVSGDAVVDQFDVSAASGVSISGYAKTSGDSTGSPYTVTESS